MDETAESDNLIHMVRTISATRAARGFADLLARVRYRGEEFVVQKGGEPVCRIVPVRSGTVRSTASEFARALQRRPPVDEAYLDTVEKVTRGQKKVPRSRWGR